jgi:hypothetical protein
MCRHVEKGEEVAKEISRFTKGKFSSSSLKKLTPPDPCPKQVRFQHNYTSCPIAGREPKIFFRPLSYRLILNKYNITTAFLTRTLPRKDELIYINPLSVSSCKLLENNNVGIIAPASSIGTSAPVTTPQSQTILSFRIGLVGLLN